MEYIYFNLDIETYRGIRCRIDDKMTLKVFDAAKVAMKKAHVHKYFIEAPFPLKVWPTRALAALKGKQANYCPPSFTRPFKGVLCEVPFLVDRFFSYFRV